MAEAYQQFRRLEFPVLTSHQTQFSFGIAVVQASHHRVRLWHATKDIYQDLSDSSTHSDPIHLFPGQTSAK